MATIITYNDVANGESGLSARNKINSLGNSTELFVTEVNSELLALTTQQNINTGKITALETIHTDHVLSVASNGLPLQVLVSGVPEKLLYMETDLVDVGTDISHTLVSSDIVINTLGIYKVFGAISLIAPVNDIVDIELYVNNLPTGFMVSAIGRGAGSIITLNNSFMTQFAAADDIHLYVTSTGTEVTISSATLTIEKTGY